MGCHGAPAPTTADPSGYSGFSLPSAAYAGEWGTHPAALKKAVVSLCCPVHACASTHRTIQACVDAWGLLFSRPRIRCSPESLFLEFVHDCRGSRPGQSQTFDVTYDIRSIVVRKQLDQDCTFASQNAALATLEGFDNPLPICSLCCVLPARTATLVDDGDPALDN